MKQGLELGLEAFNAPSFSVVEPVATPGTRRRRRSDVVIPSRTAAGRDTLTVTVTSPLKRSGRGQFTYADGTLYEGELLNDEPHGSGVAAYPSGNVYVGEWVHGVCEGRGVMIYSDGDLFEGQWKQGACDGEGVFYSGDTETVGVWSKGEKVTGNPTRIPESDPQHQGLLLRRRLVANVLRSTSLFLFPRGSVSPLTKNGSGKDRPFPPTSVLSPKPDPARWPMKSPPSATLLQVDVERPSQSPLVLDAGAAPKRNTYDPLAATAAYELPAAGGTTQRGHTLLLAVAGPSYNVHFNAARWLKYFALFMFPYLSLPHCRCPFRVNVLDLEREYVVSGAALHLDFEQPTTALYCALVGVSCVVTTFIAGTSLKYNISAQTSVGRVDLVLPLVTCVLFAAVNAGYHSYGRVAHALERVDRQSFPKLASFAASCVDSQARVCIYTWGEAGNSKVTNRHYRWRWLISAVLFGALVACLSPIFRAMEGGPAFGGERLEQFTAAVSFIGTFFMVSGVTFYVMKCTDMERQVLAQMQVVSRTAYIEGVCLLRPTDRRKMKFNLDAPLATSLSSTTEGFVGWYITRCFVLNASTCSNHSSRAASMSVFFLCVAFVGLVTFADLFYALEKDYPVLDANRSRFECAHFVGLAIALVWGALLLRYQYVLLSADNERRKHLYIADVAALYHECELQSGGASAARPQSTLIAYCRSMMLQHDHRPQLLGISMSTPLFSFSAVFVVGTFMVLAFWFVQYLVVKHNGG